MYKAHRGKIKEDEHMTNDEKIMKELEKEPYPFNLIFSKMFYMTKENIISEEDFKMSHDRYLHKIPKDEIDFFTKEIDNMIMSAPSSFTDRNKEMCLMRFKEKASYREIGERFGICGNRVMQITKKGQRILFNNQRIGFTKLIYKMLTLTLPILTSERTKYMIFLKYGYLPHYDELEIFFPDKIVISQTKWFDNNIHFQNIARHGLRRFIDELIREVVRQHEKNINENKKEDKECTDSI